MGSGSYTRPSSRRGAPAEPLRWGGLSGAAPTDTWAPAGPEPSSCGWAVRWAPARCRTSATACGSWLGRPAHGTPPPWTPAAPTATAEVERVGSRWSGSAEVERVAAPQPQSCIWAPPPPSPLDLLHTSVTRAVQAPEASPSPPHPHQVPWQTTLNSFGRGNPHTCVDPSRSAGSLDPEEGFRGAGSAQGCGAEARVLSTQGCAGQALVGPA